MTKPRLAALVAAILCLGGCGHAWMGFHDRSISSVSIVTSPNLNGGAPVAIDLVMLCDRAPADAIMALSASEWFSGREAFRKAPGVAIRSFEAAAGQSRSETRVSSPGCMKSAVVFANYAGPGSHRLPVEAGGEVQLALGETQFGLALAP